MDTIEITWQDAQELAENLQIYSEDLLSMWQAVTETCTDLDNNWSDPASKVMMPKIKACGENFKAASTDAENIAVAVAEIANTIEDVQKREGMA